MTKYNASEPDPSVEFKNAFETFDRDDSKTVSSIELINIIGMLDLKGNEEVCEFLREHTDSNGMINYEELVKVIFEVHDIWAQHVRLSFY